MTDPPSEARGEGVGWGGLWLLAAHRRPRVDSPRRRRWVVGARLLPRVGPPRQRPRVVPESVRTAGQFQQRVSASSHRAGSERPAETSSADSPLADVRGDRSGFVAYTRPLLGVVTRTSVRGGFEKWPGRAPNHGHAARELASFPAARPLTLACDRSGFSARTTTISWGLVTHCVRTRREKVAGAGSEPAISA